jgi:hypothetical protein
VLKSKACTHESKKEGRIKAWYWINKSNLELLWKVENLYVMWNILLGFFNLFIRECGCLHMCAKWKCKNHHDYYNRKECET